MSTEHDVGDYTQWLSQMAGVDVMCIPYNPYHPANESLAVERWWGVPLYRRHHAVKRLVSRPPWSRTCSCLAMCVLVAFRKADSAR